MPDDVDPVYYDPEDEETLFTYKWICLKCYQTRIVESFSPPKSYSPSPKGVEHKPGTFPDPIIRNPEDWDNADHLSEMQKLLVKYCWEMLDSLAGSFLIHKINYIWNLTAALEDYDIEAVTRTAKEYVELLDYEKIHGKDPGSYGGEEGDVSKIANVLMNLRE